MGSSCFQKSRATSYNVPGPTKLAGLVFLVYCTVLMLGPPVSSKKKEDKKKTSLPWKASPMDGDGLVSVGTISKFGPVGWEDVEHCPILEVLVVMDSGYSTARGPGRP